MLRQILCAQDTVELPDGWDGCSNVESLGMARERKMEGSGPTLALTLGEGLVELFRVQVLGQVSLGLSLSSTFPSSDKKVLRMKKNESLSK